MAGRNSQQTSSAIKELVFYDEQNPRSVVNLMSDRLKENALKIPPYLLAMSAKEIEKKFEPSMLDRQLRMAFWDEYFITQDNGKERMRIDAIYAKSCSREMFYQIINSEKRFAWILKPPEDYMLKMRAMLDIGMDRIYEIVKMPLETTRIDPKTNQVIKTINTRLVSEIIKAVAILDNRVRGAVPQHLKIQSENKSVHLHAATAGLEYDTPKTHQDILKQLANIQREISHFQDGSVQMIDIPDDETIDVTPVGGNHE